MNSTIVIHHIFLVAVWLLIHLSYQHQLLISFNHGLRPQCIYWHYKSLNFIDLPSLAHLLLLYLSLNILLERLIFLWFCTLLNYGIELPSLLGYFVSQLLYIYLGLVQLLTLLGYFIPHSNCLCFCWIHLFSILQFIHFILSRLGFEFVRQLFSLLLFGLKLFVNLFVSAEQELSPCALLAHWYLLYWFIII